MRVAAFWWSVSARGQYHAFLVQLLYMRLFIPTYIEQYLQKATYEFDTATKSWCAYVKELPGVYAQADSKEELRNELGEVIEEYILVSLYQKQTLPNFKKFARKLTYAKAR